MDKLACFHLLTIVNDTTINMDIQISVQDPAFSSFGYGIPQLDHTVFHFLFFEELLYHFLKQWHHFTSPSVELRVPVSPHLCQCLLFLFS